MRLIAEIGVNWDGDFDLAREMMEEAVDIGFDLVKFQAFKKELVSKHPEASRVFKSSITQDNINKVDSIAKDVGIEWFCTPMYEEAVSLLEPFVSRYKIREFDGRRIIKNDFSDMIKKILETKKEIMISSEKIPENCKLYGNKQIKWLYIDTPEIC